MTKQRGFTLVELLVVIMIIVSLMAILVPVVGGLQRQAVKTRAKNALTELVAAVDGYYNTYNVLPSNTSSPPSSDTTVETTEPIMSVLAGINLDRMNKKEQVFFNGEEAKGGTKNSAVGGLFRDSNSAILVDPWKKKPGSGMIRGYILLLDYDYDQQLNDPFNSGGRVIPRKVVAWSSGKDGKWSRGSSKSAVNKDNVYSWF